MFIKSVARLFDTAVKQETKSDLTAKQNPIL